MAIAVVTGAAGLVGSETVRLLAARGLDVIGIDNNSREYFFGPSASTDWERAELERTVRGYEHSSVDIRDADGIGALFRRHGNAIALVVHTAAQPSHDWAAREPFTDFSINATGTLVMLEAVREHAPDAVFIYTSTNKVYGDRPNDLPLVEQPTRWEIDQSHAYFPHGIDESMSVDMTRHSLFGASKLAADVLVQEYGRYFGMRTMTFRGGCLTGPAHSGAQLHGFLAYLVRCAVTGTPYTVIGYKGKQVRDNLHATDLAMAFWHAFQSPHAGEVYNIGGGRDTSCSVTEVIAHVERITGQPIAHSYSDTARIGDHIWWISDTRKFQRHYPGWSQAYSLERTLTDIYEAQRERARS
jgi:CDP-paratose 2-epimerase